jgi:hypothetical protein
MADLKFEYKNFGTFTGPLYLDGNYKYDETSKEGSWYEQLPVDNTFKLQDVGAVFYKDRNDYAYFHLYGVETTLLTLEKNGPADLPNLWANIQNTVFNGDILANGDVITNGNVVANGVIVANGVVSLKSNAILQGIGDMATYMTTTRTIAQSKKSFDIPHPTKENHRLRYVCPETPQADIYVRGKLKDNNVIELPEYWREMVDPDSIDVSLTPIGSYQELFVDSIQWGTKIVIKNASSGPINCSYIVYGERRDVEKNIPEYEGTTINEYPGNNNEYAINVI